MVIYELFMPNITKLKRLVMKKSSYIFPLVAMATRVLNGIG